MSPITRRRFLEYGAVAGASLFIPLRFGSYAVAQVPGGTLDPDDVTKFVTPMLIRR